MTDDVERLRLAIAELLRILKISEPTMPNAHSRFRAHPTDIAAMRFVADNAGAPMKALSRHLGIATTTATSAVDRLVRMGLVSRERLDGDRRAVALNLTAQGRRTYAAIIEEERERTRRMLAALPRADRKPLVGHLETIAARLVEDEEAASGSGSGGRRRN
ncbi:MAG: MarR family transcriptional regulator [Alphaproteobacteria bacterium]|nr:MarR family transcriptional regulator [Alphaproteobacteria bacterium]